MADIHVAGSSSFPGSIDTATTIVPGNQVVTVHQNGEAAAILAIENALGTNPQGSATDLKTRLAVSLASDGQLSTVRHQYGGTGLTATPSSGIMLFGTGSGWAQGFLGAGTGITIASGSNGATITAGGTIAGARGLFIRPWTTSSLSMATISADEAILEDVNGAQIRFASIAEPISLNLTGPSGKDANVTYGNNSFVSIWLISDGSVVKAMLSTRTIVGSGLYTSLSIGSTAALASLTSYTYSLRAGIFRTAALTQQWTDDMLQRGNTVTYGSATITALSAGGTAIPSYASITLTVPPDAAQALLDGNPTAGGTRFFVHDKAWGNMTDDSQRTQCCWTSNTDSGSFDPHTNQWLTFSSPTFCVYGVNANTANLYLKGYRLPGNLG